MFYNPNLYGKQHMSDATLRAEAEATVKDMRAALEALRDRTLGKSHYEQWNQAKSGLRDWLTAQGVGTAVELKGDDRQAFIEECKKR